jgi:hypothetical protein
MSIAGSGAAYLRRDTRWIRELLKMVRACDKKSITPHVVADYLAGINNKASLGTVDNSVGPRSIVAWRHRKGSRHGGGGGHQLYHGIEREDDSGPLPNLVNGLDIEAMFVAMAPIMMNQMCALMEGGMDPGTHHEAMNAVLSELPHNSDEMLK